MWTLQEAGTHVAGLGREVQREGGEGRRHRQGRLHHRNGSLLRLVHLAQEVF